MSSFPVLAPETFFSQAVDGPNRDKIIPDIPDVVQSVPPVYIFSVCPKPIVEERTGRGQVVIPACESGQEVSKPLVIPGIVPELFDRGEKTLGLNLIKGMDVARDIIGNAGGDVQLSEWTSNHEWRGAFISESPNPTKAQIAAARAKRKQYLEHLVNEANDKRMRNPAEKLQPYCYEAAQELNVKVNWANDLQAKGLCPFCGASTPENVAKCPTCHEVINPELYKSLRQKFTVEEPQETTTVQAAKPTAEAGKPIYDRNKQQR